MFQSISCLTELSTDDSGNEQAAVRISEEASWVCLDLRKGEALAGILSVDLDASLKWSNKAADGASELGVSLDWSWVWEGDSWWASGALDTLVDVLLVDMLVHEMLMLWREVRLTVAVLAGDLYSPWKLIKVMF